MAVVAALCVTLSLIFATMSYSRLLTTAPIVVSIAFARYFDRYDPGTKSLLFSRLTNPNTSQRSVLRLAGFILAERADQYVLSNSDLSVIAGVIEVSDEQRRHAGKAAQRFMSPVTREYVAFDVLTSYVIRTYGVSGISSAWKSDRGSAYARAAINYRVALNTSVNNVDDILRKGLADSSEVVQRAVILGLAENADGECCVIAKKLLLSIRGHKDVRLRVIAIERMSCNRCDGSVRILLEQMVYNERDLEARVKGYALLKRWREGDR